MLDILKAPPFATVQDLGRPGHRHEGVPPAGAMDPAALAWLNHRLGNPADAAGLEWALGPGTLRVSGGAKVAMGPGSGSINGRAVPPWAVVQCPPDAEVTLATPNPTRFSYLAVAGGVAVPSVLGSRSTYLPGAFGGWAGRRLHPGDQLPIGPQPVSEGIAGNTPPAYSTAVRVLSGPQAHLFDGAAWSALLGNQYAVARASDRMGYRLEGPILRHAGLAAMPSEPACPGAIQVPDGGAPIVLMPDGPTIGGYPKIAVVVSTDLGRLAQLQPGARPAFQLVTLEALRGSAPAP